MKIAFLALTCWCLSCAAVFAADSPMRLLPVDEAARDPSFFIFRARLFEIIARRDADAILRVLDPQIRNSFGGDGGVQEFKEMWKPEEVDSKLWSDLAKVLAMGGKWDGTKGFEAPYVSAAWPENLDPFDYGAITAENVRVRAKPAADGEVIGSLSFAIVHVLEWPDDTPGASWVKIQLVDGREGFVAGDFVGSAAGLRAYFEKRNGAWKLISFVAGD